MLAARKWLRHRDPEKAVRAGGRTTLNFLTSAFSSFLFNQMLEERCQLGLLHVDEPGDLTVDPLKKTPLAVDDGGLPSALFWGQGAELANGVQGEIEARVLAKYHLEPSCSKALGRLEPNAVPCDFIFQILEWRDLMNTVATSNFGSPSLRACLPPWWPPKFWARPRKISSGDGSEQPR